jgi:hypothetical protein
MISKPGQLAQRNQISANGALRFVATSKQLVPIAPQCGAQARQRWQAWEVFAHLDALEVTHADTNSFSQSLLGQIRTRSQRGDVLPEPLSMRTGFGFARRHLWIVSKCNAAKHEALHRVALSSIFWRRLRILRPPSVASRGLLKRAGSE